MRQLDQTGRGWVGGNPPRDACGSYFQSPLRETHGGPGASSCLLSISSCRGYGGANAPPILSPPWLLPGWPRQVGATGWVPPIPPSSKKRCLWLQYSPAGGTGGAARSIQPVPPRSREVEGGQGRAWGWLAGAGGCGAGGRSTKAAAKSSEAHLLGLVHGTYSSAGLRLRPGLGSHFLGKMQ